MVQPSLAQPRLSQRDVEDLLRFVAGGTETVPTAACFSADETVALLSQHRCVGRAVLRFRALAGVIASNLIARLEDAQKHIVDNYRARERVLATFLKEFCFDMKVGLVKGQSSYYRTGSVASIRRTADFDLLVSAPTTLHRRLKEAGIAKYSRPALHEFANAEYEGEQFDLHLYVPILRRLKFGTPVRESAALTSDDTAVFGRIMLEDVVRHGRPVSINDTEVVVAGSAAGALISLVAAYRDFAIHNSENMRGRPPCRLSDVCEVLEAIASDDFDERLFLELCQAHQIEEQLEWFGSLAQAVAGDTKLLAYAYALSGHPAASHTMRLVGTSFWLPFPKIPLRDFVRIPDTEDVTVVNPPCDMTLDDGARVEVDLSAAPSGSVKTLGGVRTDGKSLVFERSGPCIYLTFSVGIEISDFCRVYIECNGKKLRWENIGSVNEMRLYSSTGGARETLRHFEYSQGVVRLAYDVDPMRDVTTMLVSASVPQIPYSAYAGWMILTRLLLNRPDSRLPSLG